jgi:hypothetical protein
MAEAKSTERAAATVPSASELRMEVLAAQMKKMEEGEKLREAEERKRADFATQFLSEHITEGEMAMIRRLVQSAVKDGKTEALVYSFPSRLCSDGGRMINNNEKNWPSTLQGKAKELYDRYLAVAKPQGYKLKAMIVDFPGGVPGDVGLFLDWTP